MRVRDRAWGGAGSLSLRASRACATPPLVPAPSRDLPSCSRTMVTVGEHPSQFSWKAWFENPSRDPARRGGAISATPAQCSPAGQKHACSRGQGAYWRPCWGQRGEPSRGQGRGQGRGQRAAAPEKRIRSSLTRPWVRCSSCPIHSSSVRTCSPSSVSRAVSVTGVAAPPFRLLPGRDRGWLLVGRDIPVTTPAGRLAGPRSVWAVSAGCPCVCRAAQFGEAMPSGARA